MMGEPQFVAEGALTRIRMFTRLDVDRWQAWPRHTDPLYSPHDPKPMHGSMSDAWFDELVHRQRQLPYAVENLNRELIGRIFLRHVRVEEGSAILGMDLSPTRVGKGYGTDALDAFLTYFFGPAGFRRLYLTVAAFNTRARRLYDGRGFRYLDKHWGRYRCRANVFGDDQYGAIRHLFRIKAGLIETVMCDMALTVEAWRSTRNRAASAI